MKIIGHGGAKGLAAENSLAGFKAALKYGADAIEFDVRVTADDQAILWHNRSIINNSGVAHDIATNTFETLLANNPDLITLQQALDFIDRKTPVIIEIKPGVNTAPILNTVSQYLKQGWTTTDISFASYSQDVLRACQATLPEVPKIVVENWSSWRARRRATELGTKTIYMYECWLWPGFIKAVAHAGYELYAFPPVTPRKERVFGYFGLSGACNNPPKARKWAKYGLAGVITDYPDRFKK